MASNANFPFGGPSSRAGGISSGKTSPKSKGKKVADNSKTQGELVISVMPTPSAESKPSLKLPRAALLSKNQAKGGDASLMLVTVTVLGSPGPLRFLVDKSDKVSRVVEMALRVYAREGRLPALNSKLVELYCDNGDFKALDAMQSVGELGTRQFLLYRKKPEEIQYEEPSKLQNSQSASHHFKNWWNLMSSIVCSH